MILCQYLTCTAALSGDYKLFCILDLYLGGIYFPYSLDTVMLNNFV